MRSLIILLILLMILHPVFAFTALYKVNGVNGNQAWNFTGSTKPATETPANAPSAGLFSASNYTAVQTSDNIRARHDVTATAGSYNDFEVMEYQINITQDLSQITAINITFEGYDDW